MFRIVAIVFAVAAAGISPVLAQSPSSQKPILLKGPKTLFESVFGTPSPHAERQTDEEDRLEPDRPHFPEASTAVGKGRTVVEAGFTYGSKKGSSAAHSFPETLLRVGLFAEWFEVRVGQNSLIQKQIGSGAVNVSGLQDLYLGTKVAVTKQHGWLPAIAVIPQMTVPTASSSLTAGRVLPGVNVDLGWEIIKDVFALELLVANNQVRDEMRSARHELATGLTGAFHLTKNMEAFVEWNAFYPSQGIGAAGPRHYAVAGLVYFLNNNLAVDARVGVGLNGRSDDVIGGFGFAARF